MGRAKFEIRRNIFLEWELPESPAFISLSATAMRVLIRFLKKRTWVNKGKKGGRVYNNGGIAFTYEEAETMGVKTTAFYQALKKLIETGFIDMEHQGGAYGKDYSRYSVSDRWRDYGTDSFIRVEKKRSLPKGMDIRSNIQRKITPSQRRSSQLRKGEVIEEIQGKQGIAFAKLCNDGKNDKNVSIAGR